MSRRKHKKIMINKLELENLGTTFWGKIGDTVVGELTKRLEAQTGVNGKSFPVKKKPGRHNGSMVFLINTGKSVRPTQLINKNGVRVTPRRPNILGYHWDRAPLWGLDKKFAMVIRRELMKNLRAHLRRVSKRSK